MQSKKSHIMRIMRWLRRVRHRCGYGIHSPFAFSFVKDVVYNPGVFYAYAQLEISLHDNPAPSLRRKDVLMFFRLANYVRPATCKLVNIASDGIVAEAVHAGSRHTVMLPMNDKSPSSLTIADSWEGIAASLVSQLQPEGVIVLMGTDSTRERRRLWREITSHKNARITFDLGDFGIIFNKIRLFPQKYVINYY